jgi:hypothetical protein
MRSTVRPQLWYELPTPVAACGHHVRVGAGRLNPSAIGYTY